MSYWPVRPPQLTLGTTGRWPARRQVRLPLEQVKSHWHVLGLSGSGKSRFLCGLVLGFLDLGLPVTLLDPHGDLCRLVLRHLIARGVYRQGAAAYNRIVYLDLPAAEAQSRYLPFNVLDQSAAPDVVAADVLEALHRAWPALAEGAAPRFDSFVQFGIPPLLQAGLPLPYLIPLLTDKPFRDRLVAVQSEQDVAAFWLGWFDRLPPRLQLEYVDSTLSRLRLLTRAPVLRHSLGQRQNMLRFREQFNTGTSLLINLAVRNPDAQRLLACLVMVGAEQGAISRAALPPEARGLPHMLVVDEYPEVAARSGEAAARMLSQLRKFGLNLVIAHQNWTQASERLRGALQNAGIEVSFALGREDAERSAKLMGRIDPQQIKHQVANAARAEAMHPVFDPLQEQWEATTQLLVDQRRSRATVRLPSNRCHLWELWKRWTPRIVSLNTLPMPDPQVSAEEVNAVEATYLRRYFTTAPAQPGTSDSAIDSRTSNTALTVYRRERL